MVVGESFFIKIQLEECQELVPVEAVFAAEAVETFLTHLLDMQTVQWNVVILPPFGAMRWVVQLRVFGSVETSKLLNPLLQSLQPKAYKSRKMPWNPQALTVVHTGTGRMAAKRSTRPGARTLCNPAAWDTFRLFQRSRLQGFGRYLSCHGPRGSGRPVFSPEENYGIGLRSSDFQR